MAVKNILYGKDASAQSMITFNTPQDTLKKLNITYDNLTKLPTEIYAKIVLDKFGETAALRPEVKRRIEALLASVEKSPDVRNMLAAHLLNRYEDAQSSFVKFYDAVSSLHSIKDFLSEFANAHWEYTKPLRGFASEEFEKMSPNEKMRHAPGNMFGMEEFSQKLNRMMIWAICTVAENCDTSAVKKAAETIGAYQSTKEYFPVAEILAEASNSEPKFYGTGTLPSSPSDAVLNVCNTLLELKALEMPSKLKTQTIEQAIAELKTAVLTYDGAIILGTIGRIYKAQQLVEAEGRQPVS